MHRNSTAPSNLLISTSPKKRSKMSFASWMRMVTAVNIIIATWLLYNTLAGLQGMVR